MGGNIIKSESGPAGSQICLKVFNLFWGRNLLGVRMTNVASFSGSASSGAGLLRYAAACKTPSG
jgi:hypothetical protein